MRLVVDANILFAALLKPGITRTILALAGHEFFSPEFAIAEFKKHLPELQLKSGLSRSELVALLEELLSASSMRLVDFEKFKKQKERAIRSSPDPADIAYLALALHIDCALWSNDKILKKQNAVRVFSTSELVRQYRKK